jgi:hypothetical protein
MSTLMFFWTIRFCQWQEKQINCRNTLQDNHSCVKEFLPSALDLLGNSLQNQSRLTWKPVNHVSSKFHPVDFFIIIEDASYYHNLSLFYASWQVYDHVSSLCTLLNKTNARVQYHSPKIQRHTWTYHFSKSNSSVIYSFGATIHDALLRSIRMSWNRVCHFETFLQRCSKFSRTSYTAGPSILQWRSCHGCLGPLILVFCWKSNRNYVYMTERERDRKGIFYKKNIVAWVNPGNLPMEI